MSKGIKLVGIVLNDETIYGENYLYMMVNNLVFKVSYDSFFQVNEYVASKLFNVVKDNVNEDDVVFELYSGVGTLSLSAAQKCKKVIGVEIVANAVLNAINNAKINKINNTEFVLNDASKAVDLINLDFNKLIVDPPRSGLTKEIIDRILTSKPESIIYVSCDVQTLIRDVNLLSDEYKVEKIYVLDMFSYTYHNETVCILKKQ